jgi:hypothetical protein
MRTISARLQLLLLATLFAAGCGDITSPFEPKVATVTPSGAVDGSILEGSYESRERVALGDGTTLYLVQVIFGTGDRADGATYLTQIGVEQSTGSSGVTLLQQQYKAAEDRISFSGGLLSPGTISPSVLTTKVTIGGRTTDVTLKRII